MKNSTIALFVAVVIGLGGHSAFAHFGMVIPSDTMIMQGESRGIRLALSFAHPFESVGMDLANPRAFGVMADGEISDLRDRLVPAKVMGRGAWTTDYTVNRPGVYAFYMEPEPYWEPAEDRYIIHYTKTVVAAFGDDDGWDHEIGLKTEIVPLTRPFGLYAGNVFQGIVKLNGAPVPHATVEVAFYNQNQKSAAPTDYMITQTIKADPNGVFTYAVPRAGWWGFAALNDSADKIIKNGEKKDVEVGAVLWVAFHDWLERQ